MVTASGRQGTESVSRSVDMFLESNRLRPTIYAEHPPLLKHTCKEDRATGHVAAVSELPGHRANQAFRARGTGFTGNRPTRRRVPN